MLKKNTDLTRISVPAWVASYEGPVQASIVADAVAAYSYDSGGSTAQGNYRSIALHDGGKRG